MNIYNFKKFWSHIIFTNLFIFISILSFISSSQFSYAREYKLEKKIEFHRLTVSYFLMVDKVNSPLQSLATLFNGSGRVAADEFSKTINFLKKYNNDNFPDSMGFITQSFSDGCIDKDSCWVVAYSTDKEGILRTGADISRFPPLLDTIQWAIENENQLIVGPPFFDEYGSAHSYFALTVRNTRQFGVVVSIIDYKKIYKQMRGNWKIGELFFDLSLKSLKNKKYLEPFVLIRSNEKNISSEEFNEFKFHNVIFLTRWNEKTK